MCRHPRIALGFVAAALLLSLSFAVAQTPPPPPPNVVSPNPTPDPKAAADSAPVTLSGCLERATPAPATATGTPRATTSPTAPFALRTAPASGKEAVVYQLFPASDAVKLGEHVGHRVEIIAVMRAATNQQAGLSNAGVSPATPSGSTGMETMPTPDPTGKIAGAAVAQPLFVNSVKMLGGACDSTKR